MYSIDVIYSKLSLIWYLCPYQLEKKKKKILLKIRISFLIYFLADKGTYLAKLIKDAKKISLHSSTICNKYIYQHVWL